jgi:hypothetical protein
MRFGLSWGAQAPHHIEVAGMRYEVRTTRIAGVWTAYGTVGGVCVEATGNSEREARQKWQKTVTAMSPLLAVERRVEQALDEAAAALDDAAETIAAQSHTAQSQAVGPSPQETPLAPPAAAELPLDAASVPADARPILLPETCEIPRSADRRLRPRLPREL